ncbi:hypothetical protein Tco_0576033 [Tanacetum coccineum]
MIRNRVRDFLRIYGILCRVAELVFLAEPRNLCSLPDLGFSSGPGLTVRCMVWAYGPDDTIRHHVPPSLVCLTRLRTMFLDSGPLSVRRSMSHCASFAHESSRLFITLFLSRSTEDVDTCLHLGFLRQRELDHFCNTYNISADLGPELPGCEDTVKDAPAGKIVVCPCAAKDPLYSDNRVNVDLLALLDLHRTIIRRYPETFMCLIGLSRSFDDVLVRPTLLQEDRNMGLLDFVKSADPFKVKTGEWTLAEGEVSLNNESVNMIVPPSAKIIQIVDHTIVDKAKEHVGKKKMGVIFEELPVKRLRDDAAAATRVVPTIGGKGPVALKRLELQNEPRGVGSSFVLPPIEEFVSSSVTPTPEPDIPEGSGSSQDGGVWTHHASMGIVVSSSSGPDDETVETATVDNIYVPEWSVTNGARVDNHALCYGFNINSAQRTCMVSELRLRYEHEIKTGEKFQKKFTDTFAVVQQRDAEIAALGTRLEKDERVATEVVSLRGVCVYELEAGVAGKYQEVATLGRKMLNLVVKLGGDFKRLRKEAIGEAKLREDFKSFQDAEARRFEQKSAELDSRIADVRRDMDNDLYPYMFTAIAGRMWPLSHGVRLAVMKCAQSAECQSALGKVITLAVIKGIQEGLEAGIEHGRSGRTLAQVVAYNPGAKDDFVSAVTDFENVCNTPKNVSQRNLLDELQLLKDSPLASIMSALVLKDAQGNVEGAEASGSVPPSGSSLGVGGSATQSPTVQTHDDLFDTSVLDGAGA